MFKKVLTSLALLLTLSFGASVLADTVTLQDGLNGYTGTADTRVGNGGNNEGAASSYALIAETSTSLAIKFAIFQSEGGPVPNGATITSATLSLYKFWGPDAVFKASRLKKSWTETGLTWTATGAGQNWQSAGAMGSTDVETVADGQGSVAANTPGTCDVSSNFPASCWLHIDVTGGVQSFAGGAPNNGWKMAYVSGSNTSGPKEFYSRERAGAHATLRPKLTVTYTTPPPGGNTTTLQDGLNSYTGTADVRIGNGGTNEGSASSYALIAETSTALAIRFNVFQAEGGPVPDGATIDSATLSFYKFWGPDAVFKASRLKKSWTESGLTWSVTGAGQSWQSAGAMGSTDVEAAADGQGSVGANTPGVCDVGSNFPASCWLHIDVTSGVQAFAGGAPNNGWKLAYVSGSNTSGPKEFYSRERGGAQSVLRPKLTITWSGGGGPTVPTANLTASPPSGVGPLTVTFGAAGSSDGGSPVTGISVVPGAGLPAINWTNINETRDYTYPAGAAQYTATLTLTNAVGSSAAGPNSSRTINVTDGPVPAANFTSQQTGTTKEVVFDASTSSGNGSPITELRLTPGVGLSPITWFDPAQTRAHSYANYGSYDATLEVRNANGWSAPLQKRVDVIDPTQQAEYASDKDPAPTGVAIPTFHSMSLYYVPDPSLYSPQNPPPGEQIFVRYRKAAENPNAPGFVWKQANPMWYDRRTVGSPAQPIHPYTGRGSVVYLTPGTKYVFEVGTGASYETAQFAHYLRDESGGGMPATWSETFKEFGSPTIIQTRDGNYPAINEGGNATDGYKVYDGLGTAVITGSSTTQSAITINASYVIVRRVKVNQAYFHAVYIAPNVTNVVIEDSEFTGWAHVNPQTRDGWPHQVGGNEVGAIQLQDSNSRIVIQRNRIHDPRYGSFPWDITHPAGPVGINVRHGVRQNVIRYNEFYSDGGTADKSRWMQDGIMGTDNFSAAGAPGADSDIYHNIVQHVFDDAIEAEGGGRNVRVWGNYIDHTGAGGIATTVAHHGPIYLFRNVINRMRYYHLTGDPNDDHDGWNRGKAFKAGGRNTSNTHGGGRQFFFNNTLLQAPYNPANPAQNYPLGAGNGISGGGNEGMRRNYSRNNILQVWRSDGYSCINVGSGSGTGGNDMQYDLCNTAINYGSATGETYEDDDDVPVGSPTYKSGHGWNAGPLLYQPSAPVGRGNFQVDSANAREKGTHVFNFTRDIDNVEFAKKSGVWATSGRPDIGAHQDAASSTYMKFGKTTEQP
jgi:hypothetical protein